eukprot:12929592-Prorocentrum_lima.AAC.1
MQNFNRLEGLQEAPQKDISAYQGKILPCKMVFVKRFLTPQQSKESETTKTWKGKEWDGDMWQFCHWQ